MSFLKWLFMLVLEGAAQQSQARSDFKIQIRRPGDSFWRDDGYVSSNPEAIESSLRGASLAHPDAQFRVVDRSGRMVDFR
jgi:hypothetical protein